MKKHELTYYLWKNKNARDLYHITDYKEIRADGKVNVDRFGYIEVELVLSSKVKMDLIIHAEELFENEIKNENKRDGI